MKMIGNERQCGENDWELSGLKDSSSVVSGTITLCHGLAALHSSYGTSFSIGYW